MEAVIFDMDGVLTESESRWRVAEQEACDRLGLGFGPADFEATMGVRMGDVAELWFARSPWQGPSPAEVAAGVVDRMIELTTTGAEPLPGVAHAVSVCAEAGLRLALCSSSDDRLIEATLQALGLADAFEVVHSAEHDHHGKPHPEPYLATAAELGVDPTACVVIEDSLNGAVSARAAGMRVIAVPAPGERGSGRFGFCDLVLDSLRWLDAAVLTRLGDGVPSPSVARPRFHLAFPVDDLVAARRFYGEILGCAEGRSADVWVDFDLWGHQIVAHLDPSHDSTVVTNDVDGDNVPARHFGLVLHAAAWHDLVARLTAADVRFIIEPHTRFAGAAGEQMTCFVTDPAGNALEFKAFIDDRAVFAT